MDGIGLVLMVSAATVAAVLFIWVVGRYAKRLLEDIGE